MNGQTTHFKNFVLLVPYFPFLHSVLLVFIPDILVDQANAAILPSLQPCLGRLFCCKSVQA